MPLCSTAEVPMHEAQQLVRHALGGNTAAVEEMLEAGHDTAT